MDATSFSSEFKVAFNWDWYICVEVQTKHSVNQENAAALEDVGRKVAGLYEDIKSRMGEQDIQFWPKRLINSSGAHCWLIGVPTLPSPKPADYAQYRKLLKAWQKNMVQKKKASVIKAVEAKFIPRKTFLEEEFEEDSQTGMISSVVEAFSCEGSPPTPKAFKKIKGSNPKEVRKQFLEHTTGASGSTDTNPQTSGKLRPAKDVLQRLKYDSEYYVSEYVVGCIDRKAGILEKKVEDWMDFDEEELIAYFKNSRSGDIVWDKARKVDLIFGKRDG